MGKRIVTNPATMIDGYKTGHIHDYPDGTQVVYSTWTPRDSRTGETGVVFFGLQAFIKKYLVDEWGKNFFGQPKDEIIDRYKRRLDGYLGPDNNVGTNHIAALHDLGYLPLRFKALPEGAVVPIRVPMLTVENTDERFAWLVNYFETLMSCQLWLPSTSATTALAFRRIMERYAYATGAPVEFVDWQGHDFSFRGMGGLESAQLSGSGHLLLFTGTDTIPAIDFLEDYYDATGLIGGSVSATEHSVMCAGGNDEGNEQATFERLMNIHPNGILSVVSDTWDLWNVLTVILPNLKDQIESREGKLVIRPDSGDPVKIIVGDPEAPVGSPAHKGVVELLWDTFGGTETDKGFKVLSDSVGSIYGDSINLARADAIFLGLMKKGFASNNVVLGIGSFSYQFATRDVYGFAMKATLVKINDEWKEIYKSPVTDNGMKKSARGRIAVLNDAPKPLTPSYRMIDQQPEYTPEDQLQEVWVDGEFKVWYDLNTIRETVRRFI